MKKTLVLAIVAGMLSAGADSGGGAVYYVPTSTTTVDEDTFCGGGACTSADTIIIRGGARGGLKFQDFDGAGSYITITNENTNPDSRVEIDGRSGFGCLSISNCKYIDLRGNNDGDLAYGIKVINDMTSQTAGTVWVYGESDHIKISYIEATCEGSTVIAGIGIFVSDGSLPPSWTFDTFEIHHNYIHDTRYAGMYLGHNDPISYISPYSARFSVYNNIIENAGTYGMVLKGLNGGPNSFYNNVVDTTDVVSRPDITDEWRSGIRVRTFDSKYSVDVYDNTVFNTVGPGILAGSGSHNIYNNIVCNAGTGDHVSWGHGIKLYLGTTGTNVYDNTIIQAHRYGIYAGGSVVSVSHKRNLIGDCGSGAAGGTNLTEGTGADANIYHADVADFGFKVWSDDGDYSNDDFSLGDTELTDLNGDGTVNLEDFAVLASYWMNEDVCSPPDWCQGADFDRSGTIDLLDLATFIESWGSGRRIN